MPDIDIDFQDDKRDEVVKYVTESMDKNMLDKLLLLLPMGLKLL